MVISDETVASAEFEDGTSATGDLLIGAEGAHSLVREYLLGAEKAALQPSPIAGTCTIVQLPAEAVHKFRQYAPEHRMIIGFHPHGEFCWVGGDYYTFFAIPTNS